MTFRWGELTRIWLLVVLAVPLTAIGFFSDRAVAEWRATAIRLAEQRADASVDLLVTVFNRNMRAVQSSVLAAGIRTDLDPADSSSDLITRALASYDYPEVFFTWRRAPVRSPVMFSARAERYPAWLPATITPADFPVVTVSDDSIGSRLLERVKLDAMVGRYHSVFEIDVGAMTYQVVSVLSYDAQLSDQLDAVFGFMVNLGWAREHYIHEISNQVTRMGRMEGHAYSLQVSDGPSSPGGYAVAARTAGRRTFPFAFFDPRVIAVHWPPDLRPRHVTVLAPTSDDPALLDAIGAARRIRVVVWGSLAGLIVALTMTLRRYQRLALLRSDFVSSVTHELKTPVATISAISEIFAAGQSVTPEVSRRHGLLAFHEAKRLTRLIDNLLAYSRITDVTEAYNFERLSVHGLIEDVLAEFHSQLTVSDFTVDVDIPDDVPPIRADRVAMRLILGNLIDNAVRYSRGNRVLDIAARDSGQGMVTIEVTDKGIGIPEDELQLITRKFFRGQRADRAGTGLGLSIVARIVADHLGILRFRSSVGVGTTVIVQLPVATP